MFQFSTDVFTINEPANGCKSLVFSPSGGFGSGDRLYFLIFNLSFYATKIRRMHLPEV